jgi:hypothetical protein
MPDPALVSQSRFLMSQQGAAFVPRGEMSETFPAVLGRFTREVPLNLRLLRHSLRKSIYWVIKTILR